MSRDGGEGLLRAHPSVRWAGMSTSVDNIAAIRAYEKAGFARLKQYADPEAGPCWVMLKEL
jgi:ribosomal protein S18 acetylase RimI-like enzyme